ncbi:hypothetical protein GE061_005642 [Apolygus lucorum]|uniref:PA domain-containing protein n=1 Tax=Apolygus lucorum TaxID=248454 RepID=A0A6A4JLB4_APOLU|nr:hypothetical protein GE061_005642 [Apolygus lucorum]
MGITIAHLDDGRIQLLHAFSKAKSISDAKEGLLFMQEMLELAKAQSSETLPQAVMYTRKNVRHILSAGPAHFGKQLRGSGNKISGRIGVAYPLKACGKISNPSSIVGRIAIVQRGDCMFIDKARRIMEAGAIGGIVMDNKGNGKTSPMFAMSGDGTDDVDIPVVFLFYDDAWKLLNALAENPAMEVSLADRQSSDDESQETVPENEDSVQDFLFQPVPKDNKGEIIEVKSQDAKSGSVSPKSPADSSDDLSSLPIRLRKILDTLKAEPDPPTN